MVVAILLVLADVIGTALRWWGTWKSIFYKWIPTLEADGTENGRGDDARVVVGEDD